MASYIGLRWIAPGLQIQNPFFKALAAAAPGYSNYALLFFGILAICSTFHGWRRRGLVEQQKSLETLQSTSWKDFEFLVAEAYKRQGYAVDFSFNRGADGGVDLILQKGGRTTFVQCKQWKKSSVGAPVIREMFGIMTAERANDLIVVTSGKFTSEARTFAEANHIQLVDGPMLLELIRSVQTKGRANVAPEPLMATVTPITQPANSPKCPKCNGDMIERVAGRGAKAGQKFWGCRSYPSCNGTRPLLD
ncbi:MAG: restriction endonuclease [Chthoniobacteraceae bacterium]